MRLIDADALLEHVWRDRLDSRELIANMVVNAPTIEERKTGRWLKDLRASLNGGSYEVFVCSECKSAFNWRMKYCGHCGAKMEVEHERTD